MVSAPRHYKGELLLETPESREAYLETADHTQTFVEVPSSAIHPVNMASEYKISAVIRSGNNLTLEITEQASASFLQTLLGVIRNAQ
jgi:hypothetical protein